MIELERINDSCPVCGNPIYDLSVRFRAGRSVWVKAVCGCGFMVEIESNTIKTGEHAIDAWNRVSDK